MIGNYWFLCASCIIYDEIAFFQTCCIKINLKAHGEKVFIIYNSLSVIKNKLKRNNTFIVINLLICWWFKADVVSFFVCVASFANEQAWWITDAYQSIWKVSIKSCINEISFYIHFFVNLACHIYIKFLGVQEVLIHDIAKSNDDLFLNFN